jgi:hypothetical protein
MGLIGCETSTAEMAEDTERGTGVNEPGCDRKVTTKSTKTTKERYGTSPGTTPR